MTSRPRVLAVSLLSGALGLTGLAGALAASPADAVPAAATAIPADASASSSQVTVFLKAPHPGALARLAATPVTDRTQRLAELAKLVPSDADRASVAHTLAGEGLDVVHRSTWSLTATAPSSTVRSLFGARAASAVHGVATGPLPLLPAALTSLVSAVYPTSGGPAAFHPMATSTLDGNDFRNADSAAGATPSTGAKDSGVTVATLQLADFNSSDLTQYASDHKLADPVASGAYQGVTVDGGPSAMDDAGEGSIEVDLDQESILSTAPSAHQHAYFAPNTQAGFNDVFSSVYDDVVGNSMATAPDPHLVALSSSWGECEGETTKANIEPLEPILQSVVAAGVTIFASSGDDGIYDCRSASGTGTDNSQADVDFPASSPYVVSTGGSNLSADTSAPNTGKNWTEKTWSCTDAESCQNTNTGTGGGGGGASGSAFGSTEDGTQADFEGFAMPVYQKATLSGIYADAKTRLVPDIAADGDPQTGFEVYLTPYVPVIGGGLPGLPGAGQNLTVGGTSLASPISAAQLANTLADAGATTGVGDIHPALYSALAQGADLPATSPKQALRDVTVGQIGADGDKGSDPSVMAAPGFDTTSGVGGVLWNALAPYLTADGAPMVTAATRVGTAHGAESTIPLGFGWQAATGDDPIVLGTTEVTITEAGRSTPIFTGSAASGTHVVQGVRGHTYKLTVVGTDLAGHATTKTAQVTARYGLQHRRPKPKLHGVARVGHTLRVQPGTFDPGTHLSFHWYIGNHRTAVTSRSFKLPRAARGQHVHAVVISTKDGFVTLYRRTASSVKVR